MQDLAKKFKKLDALVPGNFFDLLNTVSKSKWCKSHFSNISKCDIVDNNMAKTLHGWLLGTRLKPVISILEEIRLMVMQRLYTKRIFATKWHFDVAHRVGKKLEENKKKS